MDDCNFELGYAVHNMRLCCTPYVRGMFVIYFCVRPVAIISLSKTTITTESYENVVPIHEIRSITIQYN